LGSPWAWLWIVFGGVENQPLAVKLAVDYLGQREKSPSQFPPKKLRGFSKFLKRNYEVF
jgi:hypothetical protein